MHRAKSPAQPRRTCSSILALVTLTRASGLLLPHFGGTPLLVARRVHPGEQVLRAHTQGSSRGQWRVVRRTQLRALVLPQH